MVEIKKRVENPKHRGGFNFQLNFALYTNEFIKITMVILQSDSCAKIK